MAGRLDHANVFWRKLARWGATSLPPSLVRYSPPVFGCLGAVAVPEARRAVARNLDRVRGPTTPLRNMVDVCATFATYASCLTETLTGGSKNAAKAEATVYGERNLLAAARAGKGIIYVTAHTAGWEIIGSLLSQQDQRLEVLLVVQAERDGGAGAIQDAVRVAGGVRVVHAGADPLASLTLLHHLKRNGIVALQLDRAPVGMRTRGARMFGAPGEIPEGPIKLAQVSGAPLVPVFSWRTGFRKYRVEVGLPRFVPRRATESELDACAQEVADAMTLFVRAHPTQWFHFVK